MKRVIFGIGFGVLFFFAFITAVRLAYFLLYSAGLLLLVSWLWTRLGARGLSIRRESPEGAYQVGEQFAEPITIQNRAPVGLPWIEVIDRSNIPGYDAGRAISLGGRRSRRWLSRGRFAARGRYQMGPIDVVTGDPFGFFRKSQTLAPSTGVTVYPRLVDVSSLMPGSAQTSGDTSAIGRYVDSPPDAFGIREHDPHDGFNRIHWKSTARLGRMMSKTFEKFEGSDVLVVLDLEQAVQRGTGAESTVEYAVSLAASVAATAVNRVQSVGLVCNDRRLTHIPSGRGAAHLRRLLEFLATAEPTGSLGLDTLLQGLAAGGSQQSLLVITPRPAGAWVDRLVEVGRGGRRRSTVLHLEAESFGGRESVAAAEAAADADPGGAYLTWWSFRAGDLLFAQPPARQAPGPMLEDLAS